MGTRKTRQKGKLLTVRLPEDVLRDFGVVAQVRDVSMSEIVFNFIRQVISDQKERTPEAFVLDGLVEIMPLPEVKKKNGHIVEQNNFLMSDPKNEDPKKAKKSVLVRKDIADAKARGAELKARRNQ